MDAKVRKFEAKALGVAPAETPGQRCGEAGEALAPLSPMETIAGIRMRAARFNLTLHALCRRAKVEPSKVARWAGGSNDPLARGFAATVGALESALEAERLRLRLETASPRFRELGESRS